MQDIWPQLKYWIDSGERFALATVVKASKPSPRGVGACLAIHEDGERFIGSVSAGCVESEVMVAAADCLKDGAARWLTFGPGEGFPWEIELSCGGKIEVRIEPYVSLVSGCAGVAEALRAGMESHAPGLLVSGWGSHAYLSETDEFLPADASIPQAALDLARSRLARGLGVEEVKIGSERVLFRMLGKRPRLFVVGASHIAINLVALAKMLQYEVVAIDPREAYARLDRFFIKPDQLRACWPAEALGDYLLGEKDALVSITHDPKIDDQALESALRSQCGYIGALGSRKSHAARCRRLATKGFAESDVTRIHGPVGLDIGSRTPAEIAVSIVAELVQWRNGGGR